MLFIQSKKNMALPLEEKWIRLAVEKILKYLGVSSEVDLTIIFTDDRRIRKLNAQFLGLDEPTDVLSFPADFTDPDSGHPYLGDVVISIPRAQAQAAENQTSVQEELLLLVVHGVLHLLGYDHASEEDQARMWTAQSEILSSLKF